jgi:thiamine kinase-like enzyme
MVSRILDELRETNVFDEPLNVKLIPGGAVNRSYHLKAGATHYFLKTYEQNHFSPSDRESLYVMQIQLSKHGIAPAPHYFSRGHDFQVEDWFEGSALDKSDIPRPQKIGLLADTLYKIHTLPVFALSINFPRDWQSYIEMSGIRVSDELQQRLNESTQCWTDTHQHDQVLCHNDLAMEHVYWGKDVVVFDWEYAACGNRYYDLASCATINNLSEQETQMLQQAYSGVSKIPFADVVKKMEEQVSLVNLTNDLWYLAARVQAF